MRSQSSNLFTKSCLLLLAMSAATAKAEDSEEVCLTSPISSQPMPNKHPDYLFFEANTKEQLEYVHTSYKQQSKNINEILFNQETQYQNTAVHLKLANHKYDLAIKLLEFGNGKKNSKGESLKEIRDRYGCTVLTLHLKLGGPASTALKLISAANVMIADNEGVTPLMYSMRGADSSVTKAILENIGPERMKAAIDAVDKHGRTVYDWANMSKEDLLKEFQKIEVDGTKAANHCFNSLFSNTDYQPFYSKVVESVERGQLFHIQNNKVIIIPSVKATLANAKELIRIATEKSKNAEASRILIFKESTKISPIVQKDINKFWKKLSNAARKLIDQGLSNESLVDLYLRRQSENRQLLQDYLSPIETDSIRVRRMREL